MIRRPCTAQNLYNSPQKAQLIKNMAVKNQNSRNPTNTLTRDPAMLELSLFDKYEKQLRSQKSPLESKQKVKGNFIGNTDKSPKLLQHDNQIDTFKSSEDSQQKSQVNKRKALRLRRIRSQEHPITMISSAQPLVESKDMCNQSSQIPLQEAVLNLKNRIKCNYRVSREGTKSNQQVLNYPKQNAVAKQIKSKMELHQQLIFQTKNPHNRASKFDSQKHLVAEVSSGYEVTDGKMSKQFGLFIQPQSTSQSTTIGRNSLGRGSQDYVSRSELKRRNIDPLASIPSDNSINSNLISRSPKIIPDPVMLKAERQMLEKRKAYGIQNSVKNAPTIISKSQFESLKSLKPRQNSNERIPGQAVHHYNSNNAKQILKSPLQIKNSGLVSSVASSGVHESSSDFPLAQNYYSQVTQSRKSHQIQSQQQIKNESIFQRRFNSIDNDSISDMVKNSPKMIAYKNSMMESRRRSQDPDMHTSPWKKMQPTPVIRKTSIQEPVTFGAQGQKETFTDKKAVIDQWEAEIKPFAKNANEHVQRLHRFNKKQDKIHAAYQDNPNLAEFNRQKGAHTEMMLSKHVQRYNEVKLREEEDQKRKRLEAQKHNQNVQLMQINQNSRHRRSQDMIKKNQDNEILQNDLRINNELKAVEEHRKHMIREHQLANQKSAQYKKSFNKQLRRYERSISSDDNNYLL